MFNISLEPALASPNACVRKYVVRLHRCKENEREGGAGRSRANVRYNIARLLNHRIFEQAEGYHGVDRGRSRGRWDVN